MLDPQTWPAMLAKATPEKLAVGMGHATYTPLRGADDCIQVNFSGTRSVAYTVTGKCR